MLLVGYFEGLDSQRAIAWRCHASRSLQSFLGYSITDPTPDHSSWTIIRQRLALEIHEQVFTKVLQSAQEKKLLKGKAVAVDSTLIEAEAAMEALCQPPAVASISIVPIDDTTDPPSVEGIVTVEALIEVYACLSSASFLVDDEIVGDMTDQGDGPYSFVWDTRQWSPGDHFITVASTRSCGSGSTLELLVQVANQVAEWITWEVSEGGNGHRYALTEGINWPDAEAQAVAAGGHVVTINDATENAWLVSTFSPLVTDQVWMGFNQLSTLGHWEWIGEATDPGEYWDGGWWEEDNPSSTSYTNWAEGEPGGLEEYGLLIVIGDGTWHDHGGPGVFQGIIEAPPAPCEGDANGDGSVDPLDSGYVLARFGCPVGTGDPSCDAADVNGDGAVDPLDTGYVLARFGPCE